MAEELLRGRAKLVSSCVHIYCIDVLCFDILAFIRYIPNATVLNKINFSNKV